uniref:Uncharacterized protein n=1 Tax=Salix viminalis TaxID=40686 RepID=A0A6N2NBD2_SALVM
MLFSMVVSSKLLCILNSLLDRNYPLKQTSFQFQHQQYGWKLVGFYMPLPRMKSILCILLRLAPLAPETETNGSNSKDLLLLELKKAKDHLALRDTCPRLLSAFQLTVREPLPNNIGYGGRHEDGRDSREAANVLRSCKRQRVSYAPFSGVCIRGEIGEWDWHVG